MKLNARQVGAAKPREKAYRLVVFPGRNDPRKTMSEASINQVFKRTGYTGKVTGHGFRHTMSTILHEEGFNTACESPRV